MDKYTKFLISRRLIANTYNQTIENIKKDKKYIEEWLKIVMFYRFNTETRMPISPSLFENLKIMQSDSRKLNKLLTNKSLLDNIIINYNATNCNIANINNINEEKFVKTIITEDYQYILFKANNDGSELSAQLNMLQFLELKGFIQYNKSNQTNIDLFNIIKDNLLLNTTFAIFELRNLSDELDKIIKDSINNELTFILIKYNSDWYFCLL